MSVAPPLDYYPREGVRLKRLLKWIVSILVIAAIVGTAIEQREWLANRWALFQLRRAERICGSFDFGKGTVVLETDPVLAAQMLKDTPDAIRLSLPGGSDAPGAGRLVSAYSSVPHMMRWIDGASIAAPTVFSHQLCGADGRRYLMRVHIDFGDDRFKISLTLANIG